ncbi:MAG: YaaA family protein, partial [Gordonibacter sp.]
MSLRFIVSPAKKMNVVDDAFAWRDLPVFLDRTEALMEAMRGRSYDEVKALWRCSDALAQLNHERFRTMDLRKSSLTPAVLAYEGIQYQHLAPQVMEATQLEYLQEHLRILSGFYGVLRPFDGVVPYRLEMQAKLGVGDAQDLYAYWGDALCRSLAQEADTIVNLASVEYAKAVLPHAADLFRLQQASGGRLARAGERAEPEPKRAQAGTVPSEFPQVPAAPHVPTALHAPAALH